MTFVSAGHIILTPIQPVGSGRSQRKSNAGRPHQKFCALPTELPRSLFMGQISCKLPETKRNCCTEGDLFLILVDACDAERGIVTVLQPFQKI